MNREVLPRETHCHAAVQSHGGFLLSAFANSASPVQPNSRKVIGRKRVFWAAYSRHQNHWYWGPPPIKYENLILIGWGRDDVRDDCTSYQAFPHYEKWGMGWENTPIYLCRGVKFDIQKIWWDSHNWN